MSCLILGEMKALAHSQRLQYSQAISTFNRIQAYNQNVLSQFRAGNTSLSYYVFTSNTEKTLFTIGQYLLIQNDPTNEAKYQLVQKL